MSTSSSNHKICTLNFDRVIARRGITDVLTPVRPSNTAELLELIGDIPQSTHSNEENRDIVVLDNEIRNFIQDGAAAKKRARPWACFTKF